MRALHLSVKFIYEASELLQSIKKVVASVFLSFPCVCLSTFCSAEQFLACPTVDIVVEPLSLFGWNSSKAMAPRVTWIRMPGKRYPTRLPFVKCGDEAGRTGRKRKMTYSDNQRERSNQIPNKKFGDIAPHVIANERGPEFQEAEQAGSSLAPENQAQDPLRKRARRNGPEETLITKFDCNDVNVVSYNEAEHRRLLVSEFHDLVKILAKEHETMEKEDNPKTIKVFDDASARLKNYSKNLPSNHVGSVPGVEVGDVFQSRQLLRMIGLHRPPRAGIYYLKPAETGHTESLATSIVFSGGYEDNVDNGDMIIYAGQGGKDPRTGKQVRDLHLNEENAALKNSFENKQPVRLIRSCHKVPCGYRYDGLYNVENYTYEKGCAGFKVFKFELRRKQHQPPLVFQIVLFKGSPHRKETNAIKEDIAELRENVRIPVVSSADNVHTLDNFKYLVRVQYPDWLPKPELLEGCCCLGGCTDAKICLCARRNGGKFPYEGNGTLVEPKVVGYECGPKCRCPLTCKNRVSQRGLKHALEIFRTSNNEWGVRTTQCIEKGAFIAEYTGDLIVDRSPNNSNNKFIFPITSSSMQGYGASSFQLVEDKGYKVDASRSGNVCRFIRKSKSSANIFAQYVLHDHRNINIPHVMLFALQNIPPELELFISSSPKHPAIVSFYKNRDKWAKQR